MKSRESKNIISVVKDGLCTGCGTCVGVCSLSAIKMVKNEPRGIYIPRLDEERARTKCNQCGICFRVCPGHSVDFRQLNSCIFGHEPQNALLGNYLTCYIGHATDHEVRYNSASGGLVTALLIFALEEGLIDGALVTKMNRDSPLEAQPFIARTKEEIMSASKSKYCPVPVNVAIKEILDTEKEQFAVVGLPCHIWGFRKAELISKELRDKISLHFGLFCTHVPSFLATEYILKRMKVEKEDVSRLNYRGEGWPGKMSIVTKQTSIRLKVEDYYGSGFGSFLFCPVRCTLCPDALAELADISFGDAWLSELRTDKIGKSMVISRSVTSGCLLDSAQKKGKIKLNAVNEEQVVQAQQGPLSFKKRLLPARVRLCKSTGKKVPNYNMKLSKTSLATYLSAMRCYAILYLGLQKHLRDSLIYRMLVGLFPLTQSSNGQIPKSCRPY